jgi:hypothetical protein
MNSSSRRLKPATDGCDPRGKVIHAHNDRGLAGVVHGLSWAPCVEAPGHAPGQRQATR